MSRTALLNVCKAINNATQPVPVEKQFLTELNRTIELMNKGDGRKPSPTYKPSSLHCIRNMYYQITQADLDKEDTAAGFVGICESGTDRHLRIQNAVSHMKDYGFDCEYIDVDQFVKQRNLQDLEIVSKEQFETKLVHRIYNLRFLCDGIVRYNGKYYILEIKTEASRKWQIREGVDPSHYDQATTYSTCFGLDGVLFVYEDRDCCNKKCYLFTVTEDMRRNIIDKIHNCDDYVKNRIPPPKPTNLPKKICAYCQYKTQCKKDV